MRLSAVLAVMTFLVAAATAADPEGDRILGRWATERNEAHVEIVREGGRYHGTIVWLKEPVYPTGDPGGMAGLPKVDRENPDPEQRMRPIIGLRLMQGFRYEGGEWVDGTIYDPENGKTYRCYLRLAEGDRLKVRGYVGFSLLGRTTVWTRVTP